MLTSCSRRAVARSSAAAGSESCCESFVADPASAPFSARKSTWKNHSCDGGARKGITSMVRCSDRPASPKTMLRRFAGASLFIASWSAVRTSVKQVLANHAQEIEAGRASRLFQEGAGPAAKFQHAQVGVNSHPARAQAPEQDAVAGLAHVGGFAGSAAAASLRCSGAAERTDRSTTGAWRCVLFFAKIFPSSPPLRRDRRRNGPSDKPSTR